MRGAKARQLCSDGEVGFFDEFGVAALRRTIPHSTIQGACHRLGPMRYHASSSPGVSGHVLKRARPICIQRSTSPSPTAAANTPTQSTAQAEVLRSLDKDNYRAIAIVNPPWQGPEGVLRPRPSHSLARAIGAPAPVTASAPPMRPSPQPLPTSPTRSTANSDRSFGAQSVHRSNSLFGSRSRIPAAPRAKSPSLKSFGKSSALSRGLQTVSSWLQAGGPLSAKGTSIKRVGCDESVLEALHSRGDMHRADMFKIYWRIVDKNPRDHDARRSLASVYAEAMDARSISRMDVDAFDRCVAIGRRALVFDGESLAVVEKLAVAQSIFTGASEDSKKWCDEAVNLSKQVGLASRARRTSGKKAGAKSELSADFYYAYWLAFRSETYRIAQCEYALSCYWAAPTSKRHFDGELRSAKVLADQLQIGG